MKTDNAKTGGRFKMNGAVDYLSEHWKGISNNRRILPVLVVLGFILSFVIPQFNIVNPYIQTIIMYIGINIILATSLNLVNGYMGEFSVGHAGFMSVGAYVSSLLMLHIFPRSLNLLFFPLSILAGGILASLVSLIVAIPSFKTRSDYLAIITLAFNFIVKSVFENIEAIGGPRGIVGIPRLTTIPWVFFWTVLSLWVIRNFVYSNYGRGVLSIREDEVASGLMSVNTRQVKLLAFALSAFFAGVAGGLFAHLLQFISPRVFDIAKSTDILIMVYLGGIGSIAGSILGATVYTILLEILRPLGMFRMVLMPLLLVFLMIYRPRGIMGLRELQWFIPVQDLNAVKRWQHKKEASNANSAS